ncbi:MAG: hypothetical protein A3C85_04380 [Candidatus Doudnabacteria bacterium RIFCSPHIGHO2_02_FULL_48_21]|uniref:ABC transporter ATP-binding protein n=1 Tax=Candidatus Doudnabacteria bacterium RIFCSPLOWO2_02_FULL_48_13 TaxID=1817845 RepID=A0A1F5QCE8_9BACT|nr:MAG: hypothetical protein A3K05_00685 [Candidatus Doudnabacteria bacterium RIFCSPHIGHO2_01_48_18]OGE79653.1 MAG: hypothetical protein A2668_00965 [Candidatus Doudnabacteria bacterium RIFCSPHIGHO2_01_FULL_48_180]OGE91453.1 MAG: hypothetical protein A3F44_01165 [Candidatus Doudnabacteria bacterium RIFCSPHIGHO2_12_FULL_47_25]OGE93068.1 MAG: hypothetical protein A3C85_04380 [Candidatus Doudnabacteria bacterium RIFCSPHIGHO2_02_FULL_48_21]OGE98075.1 MAG: hypothetical protein A3A83_02345 [Candidatu
MPYTLFFFMLVAIVLRDIQPIYFGKIIDALATGSPGAADSAIKILLILLVISFVRFVSRRGVEFINNYFQPRIMADLMQTCYEHLQRHSIGFFSSTFVGSLVTKVKRYERSFEQLADQSLFHMGRTLIGFSTIVIILMWRNWIAGTVMLAWSISYMLIAYKFTMYKMPYDLKRAAADTETTAQLADTISNNFNIKIFSNYQTEFKRFFRVLTSQFKARKKSLDIAAIGESFNHVYMILFEVGFLYLSIKLWQGGLFTVGDIVLVLTFILRLFDQLWDLGKHIRVVYEAIADANEMTEILLSEHEIKDESNAKTLIVKNGVINFQNVNFGYHEGLEILSGFNLAIKAGEKVALVGPSGGGKSTIVKLLLRFYDLQGGRISIDGQDITKVTQDSLRDALALVPQEPVLFHRTLIDNIRYAKPGASDEEVMTAAKAAHAHEFIAKTTHGYQTFVGERGVKLSGGERQRVAIARAILKDAPILVLDEATSSLDSESEYLIQDALKSLMKDHTTIVIAHRLSTIMQMDRIVVIENGKILEQGKHRELVKAKEGTYQRLWNIQAGGFVNA